MISKIYFFSDSQMKLEVADCLSKETKIRPSVFLRKHVENRLRMNTPYLGHWANALALMAAPQNVPKSMNFGLNLVDSMWFHAGDKSLDYNWYTKRLMLLGNLNNYINFHACLTVCPSMCPFICLCVSKN